MLYSNKLKGARKEVIEWIEVILVGVILALLINKFVMFRVKVPTGSMVPTINIEDSLFVTRIYNFDKIKRGDILVFDSKELNDSLLKRVIGLPGDKVVIDKGQVYVNGTKLEEDYLGSNDNFSGTYDVPEGKYFLLGDNRSISLDARYWENPFIDEEDIVGKVQFRIYPFDKFGKVK